MDKQLDGAALQALAVATVDRRSVHHCGLASASDCTVQSRARAPTDCSCCKTVPVQLGNVASTGIHATK
jgi:hypothetical protein